MALQLGGGENVHAFTAMAMAVARSGDSVAARGFAERALGSGSDPTTAARFGTMALVAMGEVEQALRLLESLPQSVLLRASLRMPEFDPVRSNPRFQALQEPNRN